MSKITVMRDGVLVEIDKPIIPVTAKYKTADQAKEAMIAWIDEFTAKVTGPVPVDEKHSWSDKEKAAQAIKDGSATAQQTALIEDEAAIRGFTKEDLSTVILAKAELFRSVVSRVAGLRGKTEGLLDAETDPMNYETILATAQTEAATLAVQLGISVD